MSTNSVIGSAGTTQETTVSMTVLGADLAENYFTNDSTLNAGDIVAIDQNLSDGVRKTNSIMDKNTIGVVSSAPSITMYNTKGANNIGRTVPVALAGRVPVKVSIENGNIKAGDYLTPSSIAGVAMKSDGEGPVIGQAMSDYNNSDIGLVVVFIKNFESGNSNSILLGDIYHIMSTSTATTTDIVSNIQSEIIRDPIAVILNKIKNNTKFLIDFVTARVTAIRGYFDEIFTKKIHTEKLCVKKTDGNEVCVNGDELDSLIQKANLVPDIQSTVNASTSESLTTDNTSEENINIPQTPEIVTEVSVPLENTIQNEAVILPPVEVQP